MEAAARPGNLRSLGFVNLVHLGTDPAGPAPLEWITRRECLVLYGPSGAGRTFCIEAGIGIVSVRLEDLGAQIRAPHRRQRHHAKILRAELVVIDEIWLVPVATDAAEGISRVADTAYGKSSVTISSNLHQVGFDEFMPKTLAMAAVDCVLHHADVCQANGVSIRLTQAVTGRKPPD
ncbi:ATP-binding protein [Arthrobacter sp. SRS-W-1-2016]|uniref:ATP-binding protein n=1 Tax=Arthrobacter sp. SRS-W-1-2016 TaxID=1930254 RepID=UPI00209B96F0|nr:ATP-binding protein [Arthrobacter sp. SRS-W-1-2016]